MADAPTPPAVRVRPEARAAEPIRRAAAFRPATYDAEARTIEVVWTTGAEVRRFDWWTNTHYREALMVSAEAVDLSRLNAGAPVLNTHSSSELEDVIGVVERAWIEGGEGRALLRFSDREEVQPIIRDIEAGILRNISAGYWVDEWAVTPATATQTELRTAVRWMPGEISFVPVPADARAQVRSATPHSFADGALPAANPPALPASTQEVRVAEPNTTPAGLPPETIDAAAAVSAARQGELARAQAIRSAGRALSLPDLAETLIAEGVTVEDAQRRMIDTMAAAARAQENPMPGHINVLRDEGDTKREALRDAFLHKAGVAAELPEAAREYRGLRMLDFARHSIELRGGNTRGMAPVEIARAAMGNRDMLARASGGGVGLHSVSDFPNLLANTANKALGRGYGSARRTFTLWARRRTLPDFKTFTVINLAGAPQLQQISPTGVDAGEISFGTLGEGAEAYRLVRYGRRLAVTFEAIINDDMDGFSRVPVMFGAAAGRLESDLFYAQMNSNPNMSDGQPLFSVPHANVFGNGVAGFSAGDGVLDVNGLGVGRRVMRLQTAANGDIIDVEPRFLLVPAALEMRALQHTSANFVAAQAGNINPAVNTSLTPIVEPRLVSPTQWFLAGDADQVDTAEYGYLEGMEAPQVTSYIDEDTDGVILKCTHSFGAKATDWRGMARATGT